MRPSRWSSNCTRNWGCRWPRLPTPVHDRAAVPLQSTPPILRPQALPGGPGLDPFARRAERRGPRLPHDRRRVSAAARQLTVGEGCGARLGESDVRVSAETEVAALAVDGQPLHPVAAPAAGLNDEEERSTVAVASRPQSRDLLGSESSCHGFPPRSSLHEYTTLGAGTGEPTTEGLGTRIAIYTRKTGVCWPSTDYYGTLSCSGNANTNRLFPALGRSSGVSPVKCDDVPPEPVLTATNWRPSTA